jgi:hypothetical protein
VLSLLPPSRAEHSPIASHQRVPSVMSPRRSTSGNFVSLGSSPSSNKPSPPPMDLSSDISFQGTKVRSVPFETHMYRSTSLLKHAQRVKHQVNQFTFNLALKESTHLATPVQPFLPLLLPGGCNNILPHFSNPIEATQICSLATYPSL